MLERAQRASLSLPAENRPRLLSGDARSFDFGETFDGAIMMFAVIGYLVLNDDVLSALRNIRRHLKDGAPFLFDFWYGPAVLLVQPSERVKVFDQSGGQVIRANSTTLDSFHHTADVSIRLWKIEGGKAVEESNELHRLRYFFPQEVSLLLTQAGFELFSLTAFPSLTEKPTEQTWNVLAVAIAR